MVKKITKYLKFVVCCALILSLIAPSYAALSASDGSAFVTKAEFDSALADFNARLTTFEAGINSKIDSQVSSYLDRNGIWNGKQQLFITDRTNHDGTVSSVTLHFNFGDFWDIEPRTVEGTVFNIQIWAQQKKIAGNGWSSNPKYHVAKMKNNRIPLIHINKSGLLALTWGYSYTVEQLINTLGPGLRSITGDAWNLGNSSMPYLFANNTWAWKHVVNITVGDTADTQNVLMMHTAYNATADQQEWMHRYWSEYQHLKPSVIEPGTDWEWDYMNVAKFMGLLIGDQSPQDFVDYVFVSKNDYINFMMSEIKYYVDTPGLDTRHTSESALIDVSFKNAKIY